VIAAKVKKNGVESVREMSMMKYSRRRQREPETHRSRKGAPRESLRERERERERERKGAVLGNKVHMEWKQSRN